MEIVLYNLVKRINSTKQPDPNSGATYQVYLKYDTSIDNPVFRLSNDGMPDYNYLKAFGRYYFITDIVSVSDKIWDIRAKMDVLGTNRNNIGNARLLVERASNRYDVSLIDNLFPAQVGLKTLVSEGTDLFSDSGYFVIGLTGKPEENPKSAVTYYKMSKDELKDLLEFFYTDTNFVDIVGESAVKGFFNPFQYIVSCQWFPFTFTTSVQDTVGVKFGWWTEPTLKGHTIDTYVTLGVPNLQKIDIPRNYSPNNDYRNNEPYTFYSLYMPFFGMIKISASQLLECSEIGYKLVVDTNTGTGFLRIYGIHEDGTESIITDVSAQVGVDIALSQVTVDIGGAITSGISGGTQGALKGASTFASAGPVGAIAGAVGGAILGTVSSAVDALSPSETTFNRNGVRAIVNFDPIPKLICHYLDCYIEGLEDVGKPLYEYVVINTIPGFIKCVNASINIEGHFEESREINSYLNGGFYYE